MKLTTLALALAAAGLAVTNAQFGCNVERVICCVNNYRAKYGLRALRKDSAVCRACQKHSQYMASRHDLAHTGYGGSDAGDRMRREGVDVGGWAENIASGQKTEDAVCAAWIKSAGHRRNIVGNYESVCVARYGDYWTQDFVNYNSGYGISTAVRCSGSAPVSSTTTTTSTTYTYRRVLYRRLISINGSLYYRYYYKLVAVPVFHDAHGDMVDDSTSDDMLPDSFDLTQVEDIASEPENPELYLTTDVDYTETAPASEPISVYKPKCPVHAA